MTIEEFAQTFDFCFVGYAEGRKCSGGLQVHHIVRGSDRKHGEDDHPATWIRTCEWCHEHRLDGMQVEQQLAIKMLLDPGNYERVIVNRMRHRADDAISENDVARFVATYFFNQRRGW